MREQMQARLKSLRSELETHEAELAKVETRRTYLRETLFQIHGAVQVMEELLAEGQPTEQRDGTNLGETMSEPTEMRLTGVRNDDNNQAT